MVEYIGMQNLINAVKGSVGLKEGKLLFGVEGTSLSLSPWGHGIKDIFYIMAFVSNK